MERRRGERMTGHKTRSVSFLPLPVALPFFIQVGRFAGFPPRALDTRSAFRGGAPRTSLSQITSGSDCAMFNGLKN